MATELESSLAPSMASLQSDYNFRRLRLPVRFFFTQLRRMAQEVPKITSKLSDNVTFDMHEPIYRTPIGFDAGVARISSAPPWKSISPDPVRLPIPCRMHDSL